MANVSFELGNRSYSIEEGKVARQADGSVIVRYGDTIVLVTACVSKEAKLDYGFFPLMVDYQEKAYAAGKIPGGFFKREGRPQTKEIISARITDRSIRPLFPDDFMNEVQITITVISYDQENDPEILGITGTSAALSLAGIPFKGPIAGVRIGRIGGNYIINPTLNERETSDIDIVLAGTGTDIIMVEGEAWEVDEETMLGALKFALPYLDQLVEKQKELLAQKGVKIMEYEPLIVPEEIIIKTEEYASGKILDAFGIPSKKARQSALNDIYKGLVEKLSDEYPDSENLISNAFHKLEGKLMRKMVFENHKRIDGREFDEVRSISCEVSFLPRTHGSALFTRGETQSLMVLTLGTKLDEKKIEDLEGESWKTFMLHYNFPSFSVGEVKPSRGPGRREIGHGVLAEKALQQVMPKDESFPYTIRLVSDILESNGSSSMASVCAGSLALMDAAVPIKTAVAGVAMGLMKENDQVAILTDILGDEDHNGDMDFKVAGTQSGITAFQMDIKITGLDFDILKKALYQAKEGRLKILDIMNQVIDKPRANISAYAPRIQTLKINPERIGALIGPGGKIIRSIQDCTGATIAVEDDGTVMIFSKTMEGMEEAVKLVKANTDEPELNAIYEGVVKGITNFGAFIEVLPGFEGLLHISEIDHKRTPSVESVFKLGDVVRVKVIGIDDNGKIRLSRKVLLNND
ncbi:polyribonucleotide nucleotidyltransferase [bacterium]|nr:polyribonucleotide nucleotidyltransferase [bacterium]